MELDAGTERDVPASRWCDRKTSRASVRDLRGFREVVVAVGLALLMGRGNWCVESERWVGSVKRSHGR